MSDVLTILVLAAAFSLSVPWLMADLKSQMGAEFVVSI